MFRKVRERIALWLAPWLEPEPPTQEWLYEVQTGVTTGTASFWKETG